MSPASRSAGAPATAAEPATVLHARIVTGAGGGPEKTILASPRHLEGTAYRALAAYLHAPGDTAFAELERRAAEQRCPLVAYEERWPIDLRLLSRLADLCRREDVRVWHGHDYKSNLYGLWLRRRLGFRFVTTVHGWVQITRRTPLYFAVDRACIRRADAVVCVSNDLVERCRGFGVAGDRLAQIDNAIDTEEYRRAAPPATSALRTELGTPAARRVIGAAGRLSDEKAFHLLIEAVGRLAATGLDIELWIAGEGEERERLEAARAALAEPDRVRLLGWRRDTRALFEAFDVFALSSLREGLPNVVLEAMAMEVPVVATRCGGLEAFARGHADVQLVDVGSVDALATGLRTVLTDDPLRARLTRDARARIEHEHSFAARMRRMVAVYDDVLRRE